MEAKLTHIISLALDWWNSLPNHWIFAIGVVAASIPLSAVIVQAVKKLHFKVTATEMTNHFIDFVVWITAFIMAAADFVITNGNNLKYLPQFLLVVVPTIKAVAPSVFTYSKAINNWFTNRQNETQKQRLSAVLRASDGLVNVPGGTTFVPPANSFGTAANGVQVPKPADNLIQL